MPTLTPLQVAVAAYAGGFRGNSITEAVAVAYAESSWNTDAANFCCNGLWQINLKAHRPPITIPNWNWRDPVHNAVAAHEIWRGAGGTFKKDWSGYGNANYQHALPQARIAQQQVLTEIAKDHGHQQDVIKRLLGGTSSSVGTTPGEGVGNSLKEGVGNVAETFIPGAKEIGAFFSVLTQANTWLRVGEALIGVVLLGLGIAAITKGTPIGSAIRTGARATPVGRAAKLLK